MQLLNLQRFFGSRPAGHSGQSVRRAQEGEVRRGGQRRQGQGEAIPNVEHFFERFVGQF